MKHISLKIKGTDTTPEMEYKVHESVITMSGVSVPSNAKEYYTPIMQWIEEFIQDPPLKQVTIKIRLRYFSVSSSVILLKIFKLFQQLPSVRIYWYYDDIDMKEVGENYESMLKIPFILINEEEL